MNKKYIVLKVIGHSTELTEFFRVCQLIQSLGDRGMSRSITVSVDGDGSGHLGFQLGDDGGNAMYEDIPPVEYEELKKLDEKYKGQFKLSIGE